MSFVGLSPFWVGAGLVALSVLLYLMQRLRVQYREISVATTLFWRAAVQEAPARVFRQRFRHIWAYLLILAICSCLWIAFAEPRWDGTDDRERYVLLLDGSAGMARGDVFERTVGQLKKDVSSLPANRRRVLWVGGQVSTLLASGEHGLLLDRRLESMAPEASRSTMEKELRHLAAVSRKDETTTVLIYGNSPVRQVVLDLMPAHYTVRRIAQAGYETGNSGITALGVSEAASGLWDRVDVLVKLENDQDRSLGPGNVAIALNGQPLEGALSIESSDGAFVLSDVPADGGLLEVSLLGDDSLVFDNHAQLRLPDRPLIKVQLSPSLSSLQSVLSADPALMLTDQAPDVVIKRKGEDIGRDIPTLEFVPQAEQETSFKLIYPGDDDSAEMLSTAVQALGLAQIDATAIAGASQKTISVSAEGGDEWRFAVWGELLGDEYNFVRSRSFPLFISKSMRWLAQTRKWHPYVAAGYPLMTRGFNGRDVLGVRYVPAVAGSEEGLTVSLLDSSVTSGSVKSAADLELADHGASIDTGNLGTALLLVTLILLSVEWCLYQKGNIP